MLIIQTVVIDADVNENAQKLCYALILDPNYPCSLGDMGDYACLPKKLGVNKRSTMMICKPVDYCRGQMNNSQKKFTSILYWWKTQQCYI